MWSTAFRERFIAEDDGLLIAKHNRNNGELLSTSPNNVSGVILYIFPVPT